MHAAILSVRAITTEDVPLITQYWLTASPDFLTGMGVDLSRMPQEHEWHAMLTEQVNTPIEKRKSYCIVWLANHVPIGHCNINKIITGEEACMHLHLWHTNDRAKGIGARLITMTLPYFFSAYNLKRLYSQPYALNPAPNKTLPKVGFEMAEQIIPIKHQSSARFL